MTDKYKIFHSFVNTSAWDKFMQF